MNLDLLVFITNKPRNGCIRGMARVFKVEYKQEVVIQLPELRKGLSLDFFSF